MLSHSDKTKLKSHDAIVVLRSTDEEGRPFHHIIKTDEEGLKKIAKDTRGNKKVSFADYGEVLFSGWGEEPTLETLQKIGELADS